MEIYFYPLSQSADLIISPSVAFEAGDIYRMDAAAEQHRRRLATRNQLLYINFPLNKGIDHEKSYLE